MQKKLFPSWLIVSNQDYSLTEEELIAEKDPDMQLILTGILNLGEELKYLEEERKNNMKELVHKSDLERANNELNDFAYIISHDLKAPLRGIANLAQWLHTDYNDKLDDQGKEYLDFMVSKVKKMELLINDILEYSKIGRREELLEVVDLNTVIHSAISAISPPEHFKIDTTELPSVSGVKTEWYQVFLNIISNAVNYNDKPEGHLSISTALFEENFEIILADNGPGIPEKYHKKVFEIFQTLNVEFDANSTGIGLSTVKKIVELNKGTVRIESIPGKGATFILRFPLNILPC